MIDALIFSRNRPIQLHCLLESLEKLTNITDVSVLHRYDEKYSEGLERVKSLHSNVKFLQENDFEEQVKQYIQVGQKHCVFFVDDIVVKNEVDVSGPCQILENNPAFLTFSLRLGTHLTYCYPNSAVQKVPDGNINSGFFMWKWKEAQHDWGYPFSVDGNIFRRSELEGWCNHLRFKNPNQFESSMQSIARHFVLQDACISYVNSKIVNTPINRVQDEFKNRTESVSIDALYSYWMNGKALDFEKIIGILNDGAHTPINIPMKEIS